MIRPLNILCLLSLAGLLVCTLIIGAETSNLLGVCSGDTTGCGAVLSSPYAKPFGIPLSLLGFAFYAATLIACLLPKPPRLYLIVTTRLAVCASAVFVFIQFYAIGDYCILCLTSAAVSLLLAITVSWLPKPLPPAPRALRTGSVAAVAAMLAIAAFVYFAAGHHLEKTDPRLATVAGRTIRLSDAIRSLGTDLPTPSNTQARYLALTNWLEREIFNTRLDAYAKLRFSTPEAVIDSLADKSAAEGTTLLTLLEALEADLAQKYPATIHLKHPPADRDFAWQDAIVLRGSPTAPTRVLVFTDYTCPHCRHLSLILADLIAEDSPDVALAYRPASPSYDYHASKAFTALRASVDAGTQRQTHAALLAADGDKDAIAAIYQRLSPTPDQERAIAAQFRQANTWGITAVPSVWINGQPIDPPYSKDQLHQAVLKAREEAK